MSPKRRTRQEGQKYIPWVNGSSIKGPSHSPILGWFRISLSSVSGLFHP